MIIAAQVEAISFAPCTIEQMARDTVGLMDALAIDRAHVLGGSMGGMIALQMTLDHPERVNKLVLGGHLSRRKIQVFSAARNPEVFLPQAGPFRS